MRARRLAALAAALIGAFAVQGAYADPGTCRVSAGTVNGFKYVTLKCARDSEPGNFEITSTAWEHEDPEEYRSLIPAAGRTFSCDLVKSRTGRSYLTLTQYWDLENCH